MHHDLFVKLQPVLKDNYNLSEKDFETVNFPTLYSYADNMVANTFEGVPKKHELT